MPRGYAGGLRNPYQGSIMGRLLAHYQKVSSYSAEELIYANFNAIQALISWQIDSEREFEGEKRTLMAACQVLVEQEQLSAEFLEFVRTLLAGWSLERLTNIAVQAQSLPLTAAKLSQDGELSKQIIILQEFLMMVLQSSQERGIREYGIQTMTRLKLEAGISEESLERMLTIIESAQSLEPMEEEEEFEESEEIVEEDGDDIGNGADPWDE